MTDKQQIAILRKALVEVVQKLEEMPDWNIAFNRGVGEAAAQFRCCRAHCGFEFSGKRWLDWTNNEIEALARKNYPAPSDTPTLAETLQAICASALGDTTLNTLPAVDAVGECEWQGRNMGQHDWIDTVDGYKRCAKCKKEATALGDAEIGGDE